MLGRVAWATVCGPMRRGLRVKRNRWNSWNSPWFYGGLAGDVVVPRQFARRIFTIMVGRRTCVWWIGDGWISWGFKPRADRVAHVSAGSIATKSDACAARWNFDLSCGWNCLRQF